MSSPATFNRGSQIGPNNIHDQQSIEKPFLHRIPSLIPFSGVPFSWEHCPGIPKKMDDNPSMTNNLLPLPPGTTTTTYNNMKSKKNKKETGAIVPRDPFLAAMVECSRSDDEDEESGGQWKGSKAVVARTLSDRFGFISMYTASCKQRCPVSDSIVYIARPGAAGKYYQRRTAR